MIDSDNQIDTPYTPKTLAKHWNCSARLVRKMLASGQLTFFTVGHKLIRIPRSSVEEYEKCQSTELSPSAESSPSSGTKRANVTGDPLALPIVVRWDPRCDELLKSLSARNARRKPQ